MHRSYLDLELTVGPPAAGGHRVAARGPGGDAGGLLVLPAAAPADPEALGRALFAALLPGAVKDVYDRTVGALAAGQALRIRLDIDPAAQSVAALPWELLHDPERGPLALHGASLVRYLPQPVPVAPLAVEPPLRVLLSAAHTAPPVAVERELRAAQDALAALGALAQVTVEPHLSAELLQRRLREGFHVWHFVGHGDGAALLLEDAQGDPAPLGAQELGALLAGSGLRLALLSACGSAGPADPVRGLAAALVRAQLPAVVAMQFAVAEESTRAFAGGFYGALAAGLPLDDCAAEGRRAVALAGGVARGEWSVPALFSRSAGGMLFALPEQPKPPCPYPGMAPFREDDARFFYGREGEIRRMVEHLRHRAQLWVIGPSGSGKSSLVRAGLLPALARSTLWAPGHWEVRQLRPGPDPAARLDAALAGLPPAPDGDAPESPRRLLVVDQLEELFTLAGRDGRARFIARLATLRGRPDVALVCAVRADFYPDLMSSDLWPIDPADRLEVAPLRGEALRAAVERPAADVGVRLEPGLAARLVADAADEPGALPLVQEALVLLWDRAPGRLLRLADYDALGGPGRSGLAAAMAARADHAIAALPPARREVARRVLLRLVQFGEGRADTRRQQPLAELDDAGAAEDLAATLRHLADARLITLTSGGAPQHPAEAAPAGAAEPGTLVDLAHEALIAGWPALRGWLAERRAAEQVRRRLDAKADEWVRLGRGGGGLLDSVELAEAERWLAGPAAADLGAGDDLQELVRASAAALRAAEDERERLRTRELEQARALAEEQRRRAEEQARTTRRLRAQSAVLALFVALALAAAGLAASRSSEAERSRAQAEQERARAEQERTLAFSRQLAAQALARRDDRFDLALLLAVEAGSVADTVEARGSLLSLLGARPQLAAYLHGHRGAVADVAVSPDGALIASAGDDGALHLWDLAGRAPLGEPLAGHTDAVTALAFSPDGHTLATASRNGSLMLWDAAARRPLGPALTGHRRAIRDVAFSPDGATVATAGEDGFVYLWDAAARAQSGQLGEGREPFTAVAFRADGRSIVAGGAGGDVTLWDMSAEEQYVLREAGAAVRALTFSADGALLAAAGDDGALQLWEVRSLSPLGEPLAAHRGAATSLAFSPDGATLASGGEDDAIVLWDVQRQQARGAPLTGHAGDVTGLAYAPDGGALVSAGADGALIVWELGAGRRIGRELAGHEGSATQVAFSPDGATLASAGQDQTVRLWDVAAAAPRAGALYGHTGPIAALAYAPDGATVASGGADGAVALWSPAANQRRGEPLGGAGAAVTALAYAPDGTLASGLRGGGVLLWDASGARRGQPLLGHTDDVSALAFSPDGRTLASAGRDRTIILWDVTTGAPRGAPLAAHRGAVTALAFTPDGSALLSAGADGAVIIWDTAGGAAEGAPLEGHGAAVLSLAVSPDGALLASGDAEGRVVLWDAATRRALGPPLAAHAGPVNDLDFAPGGQLLASAGGDGAVVLWDVARDAWRRRACAVAGRSLSAAEWSQHLGDEPRRATCPAGG